MGNHSYTLAHNKVHEQFPNFALRGVFQFCQLLSSSVQTYPIPVGSIEVQFVLSSSRWLHPVRSRPIPFPLAPSSSSGPIQFPLTPSSSAGYDSPESSECVSSAALQTSQLCLEQRVLRPEFSNAFLLPEQLLLQMPLVLLRELQLQSRHLRNTTSLAGLDLNGTISTQQQDLCDSTSLTTPL